MNLSIIKIVRTALLCLTLVSLGSLPVKAQSQTSAQADLDHYYSQRQKNRWEEYDLTRKHLHDITPVEKLMSNFAERGFDVFYDTISLFDLFEPDIFTIEQRKEIMVHCNQIVDRYKSRSLERLVDLLTLDLMSNETQYDSKMEGIEEVIRRCQKDGDKVMEAHCRHLMFHSSFYSYNYARAFANASKLADVLDHVGDGYPLKRMRYIHIGTAYYTFRDYERAYRFLHKALACEPKQPLFLDTKEVVYAFNFLASYHKIKGDLDSAAYYHRQIITYPGRENLDPVSLDIAICNLGTIEMGKSNYDQAIAMLEVGAENMKYNPAQCGFVYGAYIAIGECMVAKGDLPAAKRYIEKVTSVFNETQIAFSLNTMKAMYELKAKYYSRLGQHDKANLYIDSMLVATVNRQEINGQNTILLGEQQLKEAEIDRQRERISNQRNIIFFVLSILVLISAGLVILVRFYRKRNAAYKVLAIKAQEWAANTDEPSACKPCTEVTQEDKHIMLLLESEMQNHLYRESGLTTEMLADRLGIHRNALSHAINSTTGGNFNTYINGFRIREAVRIISQTSRKDLYIDELYERVGFGSRSSFSRIFKQFTGLAPLEFQKQGEEDPKITEF